METNIIIEDLYLYKSDEFFKKLAVSLKEPKSKKFIDLYNEKRQLEYDYEGILPAEYSHEYNKICNDFQRKIITIGVGEDWIILILKRVQMFQHIYNRIEGLPISMVGTQENVHLVLEEIIKYKLAHKISVIPKEGELLTKWGYQFSEKVDNYNFYSHIPNNFEHIDRNKWKTKKGIKRMLGMKNLTVNFLQDKNESDLEDIKTLNVGFNRYKKEIQSTPKGWHRLQKSMSKYPYWTDDNVICYMFKYKNIPVAFVVYIIINKVLTHQIINTTIGRNLHEEYVFTEDEKVEFEEIKKRISAFVHYKTVQDMVFRGVLFGYFGGAFGQAGKSLRTYKRIMNDHEIVHHIHKLEIPKERIIFETDYNGMPIHVIDKKQVRHLRFGNSIRQSSIKKSEPLKLQTKYTRDITKVFDYHKAIPSRILVLGLGAGTIPTYLYHKFPNTLIDVVELIPALKNIAIDYFCMPEDKRLNIIINDAYDYVMNIKHTYNVIFMDVFGQHGVPKKFTKDDFFTGLSDIICHDGYVAFNTWIDPSSYGNYIKKLENAFGTVIEQSAPESGNHIAFCK